MQGAEVEALADDFLDILRNNAGLGDFLAAVQHAMTDRADFIRRCDHAVFRIQQCLKHQLDRNLMVRHRSFDFIAVFSGRTVREPGAVDADALAETLRENGFVLHIDQLILQGRASAVQN